MEQSGSAARTGEQAPTAWRLKEVTGSSDYDSMQQESPLLPCNRRITDFHQRSVPLGKHLHIKTAFKFYECNAPRVHARARTHARTIIIEARTHAGTRTRTRYFLRAETTALRDFL